MLERFARDKRKRTVIATAERVERRPRLQRDAADSEQPSHPYRPGIPGRRTTQLYGRKPALFRTSPPGCEERPRRTFGERDNRSGEERPQRSYRRETRYGEHSRFEHNDRPRRTYGDSDNRSDEERPRRTFRRQAALRGEHPAGRRGSVRGATDPKAPKAAYGEKRSGKFDDRKRALGKGASSPQGHRGPHLDKRSRKGADKPVSYPKYDPAVQTGEMRLNRFIAQSGICSRREADDFILAGVVSVNGKIVTELGTKVLPDRRGALSTTNPSAARRRSTWC